MKIPIKEAINSGAWFVCKTIGWGDETVIFKIRILLFEKINLSKIDEPNKLKLDEGILWLIKIEVVNMNKQEISQELVRYRIILVDQDGFEFTNESDSHLIYLSEYAISSGLNRFVSASNIQGLKPKIKASGAIAFLLPDDDVAEYSLSVKSGDIKKI